MMSVHKMIGKFGNNRDKYSVEKQIIITMILITLTAIGMFSWISQSFAATYIPPNSNSSTNGVLSIPGTNTPASSVQCPPGHSQEYCSGYIAGFNDAIRSHQ
jgi:hypothetical protein